MNGGALGQVRQQADGKSIGMEERQDPQHTAVTVFLPAPGAELEGIGD